MSHTADSNDEDFEVGGNRFIDTRLPLTWVISSVAAIVMVMIGVAVNFSNQSATMNSKLDSLLSSVAEQKASNKERDAKYDTMKDNIYATQRLLDAHDLRLSALERGTTGKR